MKTIEQQELTNLANLIKENSHQSPIALYLSCLLFSIALHINWLIITFSCLLGFSVFIPILLKLNKKYKWFQIKIH